MFPHGETIKIIRPSTTYDRYGKAGSPTEITVHGVAFAPRQGVSGSTELNDQRNTVISGYTMYAGPTVVINPNDVILRVAAGARYNVDGEVGVWKNPFTGWAPGIEVALVRVTG